MFLTALIFFLLLAVLATVSRYEKYRKDDIALDLELPALTAYAWPYAYVEGDTIGLYVHARNDYRVKVHRVGNRTYPIVAEFSGIARRQSGKYHLRSGHKWEVTDEIKTVDWRPGFYLLHLSLVGDSTVTFNVPVLLRAKTEHKILVVAPTNTWQAYNEYGGKSNYRDRVTPKDMKAIFSVLKRLSPGLVPYNHLPQRRPFGQSITTAAVDDQLALLNGKISSDLYLIEYLEQLGVDYGVVSDREIENGSVGSGTSLLLFNNHSEYWSYGGIGMVKNYLENGKSIVFLSGNNMYREVESIASETLIVLEQQLPRSAVEPILGTFYSESGYNTFGSFRVKQQDHWIFAGTDLANDNTFGDGIISGVETDKLGPYSQGFTLLAVGDNVSGPAHVVIKELPAGNFLFNSSSIASVRALRTDAAWQQVVRNLLESVDRGV